MRRSCQKSWESTCHWSEWQAGKTEPKLMVLIHKNGKLQDLIMYTDGCHQRPAWVGYSSKVRPPSMKTTQSRPLVWQCRRKQSSTSSTGLPQEVTVKPHMPTSSQIQWTCCKVKSGIQSPDWHMHLCLTATIRNSSWMYCPGHVRVKGKDQADKTGRQSNHHKWLASQKIWSVEELETLPRVQRQGCHTIDHLEERGVERGSAWQFSLKGREKAFVNQMNTGTISKATLGKLLRDGVEHRYQPELNCVDLFSDTELHDLP